MANLPNRTLSGKRECSKESMQDIPAVMVQAISELETARRQSRHDGAVV
jgi:hypothetical protein